MSDIFLAIALLCGASLFFTLVFGFFALLRYWSHKETLAMIEKGLLKPEQLLQPTQSDRTSLRWGIILVTLGFALCLGLYPIGWIAMPGELPLNFGPWMLVGLIPFFFGVALLLMHYLPLLETMAKQGFHLLERSAQNREMGESDIAAKHPGQEQM